MTNTPKVFYDAKNYLYTIKYNGVGAIKVVLVGGSAMETLADSGHINEKTQQVVGSAVFEYLASEDRDSSEENPVVIVTETDVGNIGNPLVLNKCLKDICRRYLLG